MTRSFCLRGTVLTAVLALGTVAFSGEPNAKLIPQPGAAVYTSTVFTGSIALPGYPLLQMENVQKELGLTPEQKKALKGIAKKHADAMKKEPAFDWAKFQGMKPEEQLKARKEIGDRYVKRAEETKKQIEEVLTAKQVEQLKDMESRQRAASMLYMPQVLQQIEVTDEQKQQMQKIREKTQSRMVRLQHESQEKILGVLTPEQTKKLKELSEKGLSAWGQPAPQSEPKERPKGKRRPESREQE
jgi:hypothetical protein